MMEIILTQDMVVERSRTLPGFPQIINDILATVDDPEANLNVLVDHIKHDPVIAARVLSRANVAATKTRALSEIRDIFTATSLIGMTTVREMAVISSIAGFVDEFSPSGMPAMFWQHSIAVGVCAEELACHTATQVVGSTALVAGLLHDIGQLWLYRFNPEAFRAAWSQALTHAIGIEEVERERFGVDHSTIGNWLAGHWSLPVGICTSIGHHHTPDAVLGNQLVPLVHVSEVLSNALNLTGRDENRVTSISASACRSIGLVWNDGVRPMFGRIEARSRHANAMFDRAGEA